MSSVPRRETLQIFVDGILGRMFFEGEQFSEFFAPLELCRKARDEAELALMENLEPLLKKQADGQEISG